MGKVDEMNSGILRLAYQPPENARLAVEVMSIAELRRRGSPGHFSRLQRASFFRLFAVLEGETSPVIDFTPVTAQAMDWLLIRPQQVLRYDFSRPWGGWLVAFQPDSLIAPNRNPANHELNLNRRLEDMACKTSLDASQHAWMDACVLQMQQDSTLPVDMSVRNELLRLELGAALLRLSLWQAGGQASSAAGGVELAHFKRFRELLESGFTRHHPVHYYASALAVGEKTLNRACQKGAGQSAKACITARITLEARRLLAHTSQSVQEIAYALGFGEATNFVKFFRRETGVTPLAFRHLEAGGAG